jgi:acetyltransferase-like isoleucine patch superfamily enzyme
MRDVAKMLMRGLALICVLPALVSFACRAPLVGRDRALEGSTQLLALFPGLLGQYLRRAFLSRVLAGCDKTATICFGTTFSQVAARIDARSYVGPGCLLGRVHIERDVLIASGVQITSGGSTHGVADLTVAIRDQENVRTLVRIGEGSWIGAGAVIMADVGRGSVVGAGSVVTRPIPDWVVAAGVPARVIRSRVDSTEPPPGLAST